MGSDLAPAGSQLDLGSAETGLAVLIEACERAVEERVAELPPAQMRALLTIEQAGSLNLSRLAEALGAKLSPASRLCDRMLARGLVTRDRSAASRREIVLVPTEAGRQLAEWVRSRRRAAIREVMQGMSPDGREALVQGLRELAADSFGLAAKAR